MVPQNFEIKNRTIRERFDELRKKSPDKLERKLNLSWSNWGFGRENIEDSFTRLRKHGVDFIELHGNRYGDDLGYRPDQVSRTASDYGITIAGICGMFSPDNDLSSNRGVIRQNAIDYIRRNVALGRELGVSYMLVVPGAVGRPGKIDDSEFHRSSETLRIVADDFVSAGIKAAIEPIRSAEVSFCHTVNDALAYIEAVDHPGVQHINGDVYHMQSEESHIGEAVLASGERLINLHVADSNRCALGDGSLDVDTLIMALYVSGYNNEGHYVTPEPLGPGGDPYPAMFAQPDKALLDTMVGKTITYFRTREELLLES